MSRWAFVIVVLVVILFGAFWYVESQKEDTPAPQPVVSATAPLDSLQASVINSQIPDFSKDF